MGSAIIPTNSSIYRKKLDIEAAKLAKWKAALAKVQTGQGNATVLFWGDSTDTGYNANGTLSGNRPLAPSDCTARLFKQAGFNVNVASTLCPGAIASPVTDPTAFLAYDSRWTFGAGWGFASAMGLGYQKIYNNTTTNAANFTPTDTDGTALSFDTIEVTVFASTTFANFTIGVDSGAVITTSTQVNGTRFLKVTATTTLGTHTVNIAKTAADISKAMYLVRIVCYDSAKKQIFFFNGGLAGMGAATMVGAATILEFPNIVPDLTIINCAINDRGVITIPVYKGYMQTAINAAIATGNVILRPGNPISGTQNAEFVLANYDLAILNNLPIIDITLRQGGSTAAIASGLMSSDNVHPSRVGYQDIANAMYEVIKA